METQSVGNSTRPRALTAEEAGIRLAHLLGLDAPVPKQRMWELARRGNLPVVRLGRRVWFQLSALDAFVQNGGTARRDA